MPPVEPGKTAVVDIPFEWGNKEAYLTVQAVQLAEDRGIEKGSVLCQEQLELVPYSPKDFEVEEGKSIIDDGDNIILEGGGIVASVEKKSGDIVSVKKNGLELISEHIKPNFWRAPTDNDYVPQVGRLFKALLGVYFYKRTTKDMVLSNIKVKDKSVEVKWSSSRMPVLTAIYEAGKDGIRVSLKCRGIIFGLPRFGFKAKFNLSDDVAFYGRGPHENYCDRKTGAFLNTYRGKVEDFDHGYLYPQENGNHCDVRWLKVGGDNGLTFEALSKPFECSCHKYSLEALENATHLHELNSEEDGVYVYIDGAQRGVGGDLPAIAVTKRRYKILPNKTHQFEFIIK